MGRTSGNPPVTFRVDRQRRALLPKIAQRLGYASMTEYVIARLFYPLGFVGMMALRRVLIDVIRIERRALDGEEVTSYLTSLRSRIESQLILGADDLFDTDGSEVA